MDPKNVRSLQLRGLGVWLVTLLFLVGVGSILPDWLVNAVFILIGLALFAPVLGFFGLRWWLQRNLVQQSCPVCSTPLSGIANVKLQCPNCNTLLEVKQGKISRVTPPGTVDVEAVEVQVEVLEEGSS